MSQRFKVGSQIFNIIVDGNSAPAKLPLKIQLRNPCDFSRPAKRYAPFGEQSDSKVQHSLCFSEFQAAQCFILNLNDHEFSMPLQYDLASRTLAYPIALAINPKPTLKNHLRDRYGKKHGADEGVEAEKGDIDPIEAPAAGNPMFQHEAALTMIIHPTT